MLSTNKNLKFNASVPVGAPVSEESLKLSLQQLLFSKFRLFQDYTFEIQLSPQATNISGFDYYAIPFTVSNSQILTLKAEMLKREVVSLTVSTQVSLPHQSSPPANTSINTTNSEYELMIEEAQLSVTKESFTKRLEDATRYCFFAGDLDENNWESFYQIISYIYNWLKTNTKNLELIEDVFFTSRVYYSESYDHGLIEVQIDMSKGAKASEMYIQCETFKLSNIKISIGIHSFSDPNFVTSITGDATFEHSSTPVQVRCTVDEIQYSPSMNPIFVLQDRAELQERLNFQQIESLAQASVLPCALPEVWPIFKLDHHKWICQLGISLFDEQLSPSVDLRQSDIYMPSHSVLSPTHCMLQICARLEPEMRSNDSLVPTYTIGQVRFCRTRSNPARYVCNTVVSYDTKNPLECYGISFNYEASTIKRMDMTSASFDFLTMELEASGTLITADEKNHSFKLKVDYKHGWISDAVLLIDDKPVKIEESFTVQQNVKLMRSLWAINTFKDVTIVHS